MLPSLILLTHTKPFSKDQIKLKLDKLFEELESSKDNNKKDNTKSIKAKKNNKSNETKKTQKAIKNDDAVKKYDEKYLLDNGIDYNKGVELFGDIETYKEMLCDWYKEAQDKFNKIKEALNNKNMKNYSVEVHSLKSDARYFGIDKLAAISLDHELKSKENDIKYVSENFKNLENEFNKIIEIVSNYLK